MKKILLCLCLLMMTACTVDQATADEVLGEEGYYDVELTGWSPLACGEDDTFKSGFRARRTIINPDGTTSVRRVEGSICCGWFKDCTIRHH